MLYAISKGVLERPLKKYGPIIEMARSAATAGQGTVENMIDTSVLSTTAILTSVKTDHYNLHLVAFMSA